MIASELQFLIDPKHEPINIVTLGNPSSVISVPVRGAPCTTEQIASASDRLWCDRQQARVETRIVLDGVPHDVVWIIISVEPNVSNATLYWRVSQIELPSSWSRASAPPRPRRNTGTSATIWGPGLCYVHHRLCYRRLRASKSEIDTVVYRADVSARFTIAIRAGLTAFDGGISWPSSCIQPPCRSTVSSPVRGVTCPG